MQAEATASGERYLEALNSYFDRRGQAVMSGAFRLALGIQAPHITRRRSSQPRWGAFLQRLSATLTAWRHTIFQSSNIRYSGCSSHPRCPKLCSRVLPDTT